MARCARRPWRSALPNRPSADNLKAYLDGVGDRVRDRIVLVGEPNLVGVAFNAPARRLEDSDARARFDPVNPAPSPYANRRRPGS